LTGERGHYELAAGRDAAPYLRALERFALGGMLAEQVWDGPDRPEARMWLGRPTGSAMPLVWTHAEFLKLLVARRDGRPVELLDAMRERYGRAPPAARHTRWCNETPVTALATGRKLLIEDRRDFTLHLGWDGWQDVEDLESEALPFGLWGVVIDPARYRGRGRLNFTRRYGGRWEGQDHVVEFVDTPRVQTLVHVTPDAERASAKRGG
jgi:glucoamylase